MHDLLVGDAVDHRLLCLEFLGRGRLVTAGDGFLDFLQRSAQRRLEARVVLTPHFRLPGTFACLGSVCHVRESSLATVGAVGGYGCAWSRKQSEPSVRWSTPKRPGIIATFRVWRKPNPLPVARFVAFSPILRRFFVCATHSKPDPREGRDAHPRLAMNLLKAL